MLNNTCIPVMEPTEMKSMRSDSHSAINIQAFQPRYHDEYNLYWYFVDTRYGKLYIGLTKAQNDSDKSTTTYPKIIEMGLTLARSESLIRVIEQWLECGLDLVPVETAPKHFDKIYIVPKEEYKDSKSGQIVVAIDNGFLRTLVKPSPQLLHLANIYTNSIPINLIISQIDITGTQLDSIVPGSILLIPDSYLSEWPILLKSLVTGQIEHQAVLEKDHRTITLHRMPIKSEISLIDNTHHARNENRCERLTIASVATLNIPLDLLHGWQDENYMCLDHSLNQDTLEVWCRSRVIASGRIIPVTTGCGLFIDTCY
jgi:hypothetical protein